MKPIRINVLLCLPFSLLALGVAGAAEPAAGSEGPLDQVIVEGTRADLVKLAREVLASQERFFKRYNELNTKRKYNVRCTSEAETGTRFRKKVCRPVYEDEATAVEGRDFALAIGQGASVGSTSGGASASGGVMAAGSTQGGAGSSGMGLATGPQAGPAQGNAPVSGGRTTAAFVDIDSGRPEFQQNVIEVARKNPELVKMLEEHAALVKRYEDLYRKVNGRAPKEAEDARAAASADR